MTFRSTWGELLDRCRSLEADTVLVTPETERPFAVEAVDDDRVVVRFLDADDERILRRDQFEVLHDRLAGDGQGIPLADLPAGVEPYVSVLSLAPRYAVDEAAGTIRRADGEAPEGSPYLRPRWTARTTPERVRDDAVLLSGMLDRHDVDDPGSLSADALADLYVLLSDVQRGTGRLRREVGEELLEHIGPEGRYHGRFGTVSRASRQRRRPKDDEAVLEELDERGIPREWVLGVDPDKLDIVIAVTGVDERDVYDVEEQVYAQKTGVEEAEKQARLEGLRERLRALDAAGVPEAEALRHDIDDLEERLDALLAAG